MSVDRAVELRPRLPRIQTWRVTYRYRGELLEVEHIWCTARRWARIPGDRKASWAAKYIGPFVIAVKVAA